MSARVMVAALVTVEVEGPIRLLSENSGTFSSLLAAATI
jgi:hypothetical protein